ncbi:MAG: type II toxin-antitoxin system VapC family toxin [Fimbriimonas sp.]
MRFLLDTNAFLFMLERPHRLSPTALEIVENRENLLFLSPVSTFEILQKQAAGKLEINLPPGVNLGTLREQLGIEELPFDEQSVLHLPKLPLHHRDPFNRMLICQALETQMPIISSDRELRPYPVQVIW